MPWPDRSFTIQFEVDPHAPKPDLYNTQIPFYIMSRRFVSLLASAGVNFETFDAVASDKTMKTVLPWDYEVFRLLEAYPAIDLERSDIRGEMFKDYRYRRLVIKDEYVASDKLMFFDTTLTAHLIVKEPLKEMIEEAGITGCTFVPLESVVGGFWSKEEWGGESQPVEKPQEVVSEEQPNASVTERPLTTSDKADLRQDIENARELIEFGEGDAPGHIVREIKKAVNLRRGEELPKVELQQAALQLGFLWGEQVCRAYGWHWAKIVEDDQNERLAVISPDRAFYVLPLNFIWLHFEEQERQETVALLFNMLADPGSSFVRAQPQSFQGLT